MRGYRRSRTPTGSASLDRLSMLTLAPDLIGFLSAYDTGTQGRNFTCEPPTHVLLEMKCSSPGPLECPARSSPTILFFIPFAVSKTSQSIPRLVPSTGFEPVSSGFNPGAHASASDITPPCELRRHTTYISNHLESS